MRFGRLFNLATAVSTAFFVASIAAWIATDRFDWHKHSLTAPGGFVGLDHFLGFPQLAVFNDQVGGPYHGGIIGISGRSSSPVGSYFDAPGVYYRHFRWRNGEVLWTLLINIPE